MAKKEIHLTADGKKDLEKELEETKVSLSEELEKSEALRAELEKGSGKSK